MKTAQDFLRHEIPAKMWKHISGDLELIIIRAMYKYAESKTAELESSIPTIKPDDLLHQRYEILHKNILDILDNHFEPPKTVAESALIDILKAIQFEILCDPDIVESDINDKMLSNLYAELEDCHDRIRELEGCLNSTL